MEGWRAMAGSLLDSLNRFSSREICSREQSDGKDSSASPVCGECPGEKTGVLLSLKQYQKLLEDLHDLAVIAERRDEEPIPLEEMQRRLILLQEYSPLKEAYMKPLVVEYPEELPGLLKMTEEQFAVEVRFLAAAKLFELGKLSSGKAAAMAGLGGEFLHKLGGYGFHAINLHDEQIDAELNAAAELAP